MSGGVDSCVAAYLLKEQGYEVIGLFMRTGVRGGPPQPTCALPVMEPLPEERPSRRGCCSASDASDARRVADSLDIPFYALDFEQDFERIIDYFVDEYTHGRTPNPCVMCNNWLKFGRLWDYARHIEAECIATGHYAQVRGGRLLRARDPAKDQSYVLFGIQRDLLPHLMFPIGEFLKPQVREIARKLDLSVADKPESQEICFVPSRDYQGLIAARLPEFDGAGEIVDTEGNVIGRHEGFQGYTIGQRKGLGVALGSRRYVIEIDPETRRVVIGNRDELLGQQLLADRVNWLCDPPMCPVDCEVKIRYLHRPASATVTPLGDSRVRVMFRDSQSAITPGQAVVFYDGEQLLGGAYILSATITA